MSERFKYSLNCVYRCENFAQHVAQNHFPRVPIGSAGGINGWYITLIRLNDQNNIPMVYPGIFADNKPTLRLRRFFRVIKKGGSSRFKTWGCLTTIFENGPVGSYMKIASLLKRKNGYLDDDGALTVEYGIHVDAVLGKDNIWEFNFYDDGALTVEYGIHVDGILGSDGIWKFNFHDKFFNSNDALTIEYGYSEGGSQNALYGHKKLLRFHSPLFQNQETEFIPIDIEKWQIEECLQIAHGVRIQLDRDCWLILWIAHYKRLRNVVLYADQQLVEKYCSPEDEPFEIWEIENCIKLGMRHLLVHLVNRLKDSKGLKNVIQKLDIEKMSGEAMKTFVAKVFELKN